MTIQIARRIGDALGVSSATRIKELDTALREYVRSVGQGATVPLTGTLPYSSLTGVPATFPPSAHTHPNGDLTGYTAADVLAKLLTVDGAASGLDADLLDGISSTGFARQSVAETIAANWIFDTGQLRGKTNNARPLITFEDQSLADDATGTFAVCAHGLVLVIGSSGGNVARNGLFWVASSAETTGAISVGANFSLGTTVNPDVDNNTNAWMSAASTLSVKNRLGATRDIVVVSFGRA